MGDIIEKKVLLARKKATQEKIKQSTDKNELRLFDYIYFNPENNPLPTSKKKISNVSGNIKEIIPGNIEETTGGSTENESSETTEAEQPTEEQGNERIMEILDSDLTDLHKDRIEEEHVDNENLEQCQNDESDDTSDDPDCRNAPRLKIGENGQLILDEKSLCIKTTAEKNNVNVIIENIEENDDSYVHGKYNKKRKRSTGWTFNETARFYKALSTVGTDFLVMQSLFKWRSREELKLKFKKEERNNKELIDKALSDSTQFDFSLFEESDYDPEEDRKTYKTDEINRKKELLKEKKKKNKEERENEKKELKRLNKERKQLLRKTFKPRRNNRNLRCSSVSVMDENSNDSRATSISVDIQELVFEISVVDKNPEGARANQEMLVSDQSQETLSNNDNEDEQTTFNFLQGR